MGVTIRALAHKLNLSPSTVSQALNGKGSLRKETRERVRKTARMMGYFISTDPFGVLPELSGRPMRVITSSSRKIEESWGTSMMVVKEISKCLEPYRMPVLLASDEQLLDDLPIDHLGTLVFGGFVSEDLHRPLRESKQPVVVIGSHVSSKEFCSVEPDAITGMRMGISLLHSLGHSRIGFVNGPKTTLMSDMKLTGFVRGMFDHGLAAEYVVDSVGDHPDSRDRVRNLLSDSWHGLTAVICAYEYIGALVIEEASQLGISVPSQLSVISFCDEKPSNTTTPPLTTISIPLEKLARLAVSQILSLRMNSDFSGTRVVAAPELVERGSTDRVHMTG